MLCYVHIQFWFCIKWIMNTNTHTHKPLKPILWCTLLIGVQVSQFFVGEFCLFLYFKHANNVSCIFFFSNKLYWNYQNGKVNIHIKIDESIIWSIIKIHKQLVVQKWNQWNWNINSDGIRRKMNNNFFLRNELDLFIHFGQLVDGGKGE